MSKVGGPAPSLNGWNAEYVLTVLEQYKADPDSVDASWKHFFQGFELAATLKAQGLLGEEGAGSTNGKSSSSNGAVAHEAFGADSDSHGGEATPENFDSRSLQSRIDSLIYHYRDIGHMKADIDPLGLRILEDKNLKIEDFRLTPDHLDQEFFKEHFRYGAPSTTLRELLANLDSTYCGSIGVEYMDIQSTEQRRWLQNRMEPFLNKEPLSRDARLRCADLLQQATAFEKFLHSNYVGQKRFSLEGGETLIPVLDELINTSAEHGVEQIVFGMAHRGRLNVLANTIKKELSKIFSEFEDNFQPNTIMGDGDVKYHKGYSSDHITPTGKKVHLSLTANPSHLEAVDPVVLGRVRSKQRNMGDTERRRAVGLLIHGDAAFAGQGIVQEILNLSQLEGYRTGGTIHVIINNQIGFTTIPFDARSGNYCTDIAKMIQAPIFHVNGDDPDACLRVAKIAAEFRARFQKDVVIDLYCYRRHGHNEGDEPSFTQPLLYEFIKKHPAPFEIYNNHLIEQGVSTAHELKQLAEAYDAKLKAAYEEAHNNQGNAIPDSYHKEWEGISPDWSYAPAKTAVSKKLLSEIAECWTRFPQGFKPHTKVEAVMKKRQDTVKKGEGIDWAGAEALAIGSLLLEKVPVRYSGQDCRRGTFSQRHAVLWDRESATPYIPLLHIRQAGEQARFCVYDSCLSEAGVLGFDYGYSLDNPNMMICWEAQFGDFANGAQTIIDQFIATSQSKWNRVSPLVMMLPHGYEGQGPEHSSGWLERFLQLSAEENMQVCNMTEPSQLFHVLRRQFKRKFRRPLVIMTPKSGLRNPRVVSSLKAFTDGGFEEILDDSRSLDAKKVQNIILCSGKVYYDIIEALEAAPRPDTAVIRIEQIYPFHGEKLMNILSRYPKAKHFTWCQEETQNKGAWSFVEPVLRDLLKTEIRYAGRERAASPAVGSLRLHKQEQEQLIQLALKG